MQTKDGAPVRVVVDFDGLDTLITMLARDGYQVIGPQVSDGAIIYAELDSAQQLPIGWLDEQEAGSYRLVRGAGDAAFAHVVGPHSWKRYLYPPEQKLWSAERSESGGFTIVPNGDPPPRYAFIGVRSCELHAMAIQDRVFGRTPVNGDAGNGDAGKDIHPDPGYAEKRANALIIAVNCGRAASTCFCVSMKTGPKAEDGYDLALTELMGDGRHDFLMEAGSDRGAELLMALPHRPVEIADTKAAAAAVNRAVAQNRRSMISNVATLLKHNLEHKRWEQVAERCLSCANCTMVCPTCFCSTVEDTTALDGSNADRWRKWDSCFTVDFSFIHGGTVRRETKTRYRQWMTHKLSSWHDQFGSSGCTGCGRCITWCPVGIDITEEARAIRDSQGAN